MQQALYNLFDFYPLAASEGFSLEAWQIGAVAFAFVGVILIVTFLLERWTVGLHA